MPPIPDAAVWSNVALILKLAYLNLITSEKMASLAGFL
jgi:hypothetical protein